MCGIVGYIGRERIDVFNLIKKSLMEVEYRGYDSAGVAYLGEDSLQVIRCIGSPIHLEQGERDNHGTIGIGHTRWATHGKPSEANAHPHVDCTGDIAIVHNGTIENYADLKAELIAAGHRFQSETDTEVLAHLIEDAHRDRSLTDAVATVLPRIIGAYGIVVLSRREPEQLVAARVSSPLLIGIGEHSHMIVSDSCGFTEHYSRVIELSDYELVTLTADTYVVRMLDGSVVEKHDRVLEASERYNGKGEYPYNMLKEICDQPFALQAGLSGRIDLEAGMPVLGGIREIMPQLANVSNVIFTGCGTSFHAALYGKLLFEQLVSLPARAEVASELQYQRVNEPPASTLVVFLTQSGESMDTQEILVDLKRRGYLCIGIVNKAGTIIPRTTGVGIFIRAGYEKGVASTKAFTSQMMAIMLLGVTMARQRGMSKIEGQEHLAELSAIPNHVSSLVAGLRQPMQDLARELSTARNLFFLGKKYSLAVALEAALKVKEITYIPTEAYPAGETKHGPLALVDAAYTAFVIAPEANIFEKTFLAAHEVATHGGRVILVTSDVLKGRDVEHKATQVITVPTLRFNYLYPFLTVVPFQLLAYEMAVLLGRDPDYPRNLAKAVTVQ